MALYFDISRFKCPHCGKPIAVNEFQDFSTRFSKREAFNCPHCNTKLNWAKRSHQLAHFSMWAALLTFPLPFFGLYSFGVAIWVLGFFLLASAIGMMLKKLVIDES